MNQDDHQSMAHILVSKGLLSQNQVTKALEYQCRLPPGQYMSFTQVLVEFEYLSETELAEALGHGVEEISDPIGQVLVEQGLVSYEQLTQAMKILESFPRGQVINVLVDLGFTTREVVEQAISQHQLDQSKRLKSASEDYLESHHLGPDAEAEDAEVNAEFTSPKPAEAVVKPEPVKTNPVHLPLGRKLIAKGYLTEDELKDAIEYQQRLPQMLYRQIGQILIELGYINQEQLDEALSEEKPRPRSRIGELLVQDGLISEWQLSHALSLQFSPAYAQKRLGQILIDLKYTEREAIENTVSKYFKPEAASAPAATVAAPTPKPTQPVSSPEPTHRPLGQILMDKGFVAQWQLDQALKAQQANAGEYMPLGDILIANGHLSEEQLQRALADQKPFKQVPVGQILVSEGVVEEWQLAQALSQQLAEAQSPRQPLGQVLVNLGFTTQDTIEQAVIRYYKQRRQTQ